jgi:formate dehydrogenase major subunit
VADIHVPIRAGSDIAFLGGLVPYILENRRYFLEYVVNYTNAAAIIGEEFRDTEHLDGLFSGWDSEKNQYNPKSWAYEGAEPTPAAGAHEQLAGEARSERAQAKARRRDETLQHERCVFQILSRHFAR